MAYLDHAATTPMLEEVIAAMSAAMTRVGNPSSLHSSGRQARRTVEEAREQLADAIGARPSEVIFTSGGTEADNLAVKGIFLARRAEDASRRRVLVSAVEHHAVLDSADWLVEHEGAELVVLPVDETGTVQPRALSAAIEQDPASVAVISVMWANNEVGTVQPIAELAAIARAHGIPFHTDAVQAAGVLPVSFADSGVDAMTVTGHKLGGPYGTGALLLGRGIACMPVLHGGGQERDVRSGTIDTPGVVGFATATAVAVSRRDRAAARLTGLRQALLEGIQQVVPDAVLNGHPTRRLPGNLHLSFPGCEGDSLLMLLDARGIECSTGSACSAGVSQPSHVLLAMGADQARARGSLRLSLGHTSTAEDVRAVIEAIGPVVERARRAGMASGSTAGSSELAAGTDLTDLAAAGTDLAGRSL
ncbi:MAG TPA: cysteine desulfurase family protein [Jatrophihabitans sp.]|nr:cysteine desulfurase family protein [Jatrophihabitans sp.]